MLERSAMAIGRVGGAGLLVAALFGCVSRTHVENAALTMPWPKAPGQDLLVYSPPNADYPSVGGDILRGASPADRPIGPAIALPPVVVPGQR